ncbi:MAG TPA: lamin tail domain-containing protein [Pyrinomonadaceae bacterium]|nr:lamin tail domain-containing protein [Pyrinomonadaceae bacterium]
MLKSMQYRLPLIAALVFSSFLCTVQTIRAQKSLNGHQSSVKVKESPDAERISKDVPAPNVATVGQLVISEFRVRGPNGLNDEFIEIFNNSGADHTVAGGGTGYAVAASNGVARCVIPNGTVIPNRGHYLCVNSVGYSLASYPAGNGTTATGDATYTTDIPDNAGIAIFNTSVAANFTLANRLDAVGSTSEANTLYKEGTGYPALTPFSIDYSFYRDNCGKGGSITTFGNCPSFGNLVDTNNNAADFIFVDTNGTSAGAGQRLGAPGPENLSSPIQRNASMKPVLLDPCVSSASPPNRVRDFTSDPPNNSTFGTVDIRRTFINQTGGNVTRLRFRIVDQTTFPAPSGTADLRHRTSSAVVVTVDRPPCGSGTSNVTVQGTTVEAPPSQPNGGAFNSSWSAGTVTLATPLANGASIDIRFLLGIQQTGNFKVLLNIEALP